MRYFITSRCIPYLPGNATAQLPVPCASPTTPACAWCACHCGSGWKIIRAVFSKSPNHCSAVSDGLCRPRLPFHKLIGHPE